MDILFWLGDKDRPLQVVTPCVCGCDKREGDHRAYLTVSDSDGHGLTIRMSDAELVGFSSRIERLIELRKAGLA